MKNILKSLLASVVFGLSVSCASETLPRDNTTIHERFTTQAERTDAFPDTSNTGKKTNLARLNVPVQNDGKQHFKAPPKTKSVEFDKAKNRAISKEDLGTKPDTALSPSPLSATTVETNSLEKDRAPLDSPTNSTPDELLSVKSDEHSKLNLPLHSDEIAQSSQDTIVESTSSVPGGSTQQGALDANNSFGAPALVAEPNNKETTVVTEQVTGQMNIVFGTRTQIDEKGNPELGAMDRYTVHLMLGGRLRISGIISRQPRILSKFLGRVQQEAKLVYDLKFSLLPENSNEKKPEQVLGTWTGTIPIDERGVYLLSVSKKNGSANTQISYHGNATNNSPASDDYFSGSILGKPDGKKGGLSEKLTEYSRLMKGKKVTITAKKVDPLTFQDVVLPSGPLRSDPRSQVRGNLDYDYDTGNWYTNGIHFEYDSSEGKVEDVFTGSIKWEEDELRKQNGRGKYEFNLRLNEEKNRRADDESSFFTNTGSDESMFFAVDSNIPTLSGSINYEDSFAPGSTEDEPIVVQSKIHYNLKANGFQRSQILNFLKLWLLLVGPANDE